MVEQDTIEVNKEHVKIDKQHVEDRVRDWKKKIADLFSTIESWLDSSEYKEYSFKLGPPLKMYEELMFQFDVSATEVDTADIYLNNKIVLAIKPKGLWVIGANGLIDILSFNGSIKLINIAEQFDSPHWIFYSSDNKKGAEFTKESFLQLLGR